MSETQYDVIAIGNAIVDVMAPCEDARIDELGIQEIYCGGDLVGYGPHPNEVCALIAERGIPTITGAMTTRSPATMRTAAAPT